MAYVEQDYVTVTQKPTIADLNQVSENLGWVHDNRADSTYYGSTPLYAGASGNLGLGTAGQWWAVPGASVTVNRVGTYVVFSVADCQTDTTVGTYQFATRMRYNGTAFGGSAILQVPENIEATITTNGTLVVSAVPGTVALFAQLASLPALGRGTVYADNSRISVCLVKTP